MPVYNNITRGIQRSHLENVDVPLQYFEDRAQLRVDWCPRQYGGHWAAIMAKYTTRITLFYQGEIAIIGAKVV